MLLTDFYTINTLENTAGKAIATITINKNHPIFEGHFPGNPVTPGVCMMQIIKELTEQVVEKKLFMAAAVNVKFMAIINPEKTPNLELTLDIEETENGFRVKNITTFNETVALKLTTHYTVI
ncbi:3-hydroxyacyl-ACP dehydratase [Bizionia myxarmorum]|uniref:3-hydroxyacyl-ACP dehydratase n=1 Tax=Bizionia myxarmorum TaxID=291186 RepID=A0A5D0RAS1_9FLAO|nr:3-hydroxyacyl-ACP dehydratase [Bizionia myxarmorum]TYB78597.1 3-hydroxyacyl-ACP dehydratase [Bizionia myxarmorum]